MADDDRGDQMLTREALQSTSLAHDLVFVNDGEELLAYLRHEGAYSNLGGNHEPHLVLLDLNMPRMDGREALAEMKADAALRHIPVVVLTTSDADSDIIRSYNLGVNSFIQKPVGFDRLVSVLTTVSEYWFHTVLLPTSR